MTRFFNFPFTLDRPGASLPLSRPSITMKTTLTFLGLLCLALSGSAAEPKIVPREAWTDTQPAIGPALRQPAQIRLVTIHQTESRNPDAISRADEKKRLRAILASHQKSARANNEKKVWDDIAYHYIIGPSGDIYQCRSLDYQSDSATVLRSALRGNITVCLLGDFRTAPEKQGDKPPTETPDQHPTPAALESLVTLIASTLHRNSLNIEAVKAHRELPMIALGSDCPGGLFYPTIQTEILPKVEAKLQELGKK